MIKADDYFLANPLVEAKTFRDIADARATAHRLARRGHTIAVCQVYSIIRPSEQPNPDTETVE